MNISIVHCDGEYVPNPNPQGDTPLEEFWHVRSSLLAASQAHGETGPESRSYDPSYWIVEDQYNDELYQNMQVYEPESWTVAWLSDLIDALRAHGNWGIRIGIIDDAQLFVFADRVLAAGPIFAKCRDLESVVKVARRAAEEFKERKYGPLARQLEFIQTLLPAAMMTANANTFAYVATFDGYQLFEGNAIWILQTERESERRLDTQSGVIRTTAVTADQTIHREYCRDFSPYTKVLPPFWLLTYLVKDRTQTMFNLVDEDQNPVETITIGKIITDAELQQRNISGTRVET